MKLYKHTMVCWSDKPLEESEDLQIALEQHEIWFEDWETLEIRAKDDVFYFPEDVEVWFNLPKDWGKEDE